MHRSSVPRVPGLRQALWAFVLTGVLSLLPSACTSMGRAGDYEKSVMPDSAPEVAQSAGAERPAARSAPSAALMSVAPGTVDTTAVVTPRERLRVYTADLALSVARVAEARSSIITLVQDAGGYVEASADRRLTVRVPSQRFSEILGRIEDLGDLRRRSVETADVTDQYADLERRIEIAERSRERLRQLLGGAEDAEERVAIVREIRRLTEEIEELRAALSSLSELIAYSRIDVELIARMGEVMVTRGRISFDWIASLDPLSPSTGAARRPVSIDIPSDYAVFSQGRQVRAETADGTRLRIGAVRNEPAGDEAFWADALLFHLGPLYAKTETLGAGSFRGVLFESGDPRPYSYLVLVRVSRPGEMVVAEVFFPDPDARRTHLARIRGSIEEAEL